MPQKKGHSRRGLVLAGLLVLTLPACATVGRPFPSVELDSLVIGQTQAPDVVRLFGQPWRIGVDDGQKTWTYGYYRYSLFGPARTKDLVIRFGPGDVVSSYSFSATNDK